MIAFVVRISVGQHRKSERVEHFNGAHIDACADDAADVQRQEVEIVVSVKRVTIEFDVAFDLQMLACFEQRPRRRGQAHAAHVEVREPRAALIEDVIDPGQHALA